ncbi:hypothetical protein BK007_10150 [Methanobacterium subterraneum]|uniref:Uncharacterized protein n=1 Tax=Methanobacterium subterraneum TaxID=59277 RepID=A0A2H4VE17_9EURY|nr:hypothetical protein BK007_10150 [Methanobacterium subterraneum]PKL73422.1 MAG: hypothetical protein CVV29_03560 [Methanobacteriales archaeon HGW-Methanobacteriales-2]
MVIKMHKVCKNISFKRSVIFINQTFECLFDENIGKFQFHKLMKNEVYNHGLILFLYMKNQTLVNISPFKVW